MRTLNQNAVKYPSSLFTRTGSTLTTNWDELVRPAMDVQIFMDDPERILGFWVTIKSTNQQIPFYHVKETDEFDLFLPVESMTPVSLRNLQIKVYNEQSY